jgi:hypothetical protein
MNGGVLAHRRGLQRSKSARSASSMSAYRLPAGLSALWRKPFSGDYTGWLRQEDSNCQIPKELKVLAQLLTRELFHILSRVRNSVGKQIFIAGIRFGRNIFPLPPRTIITSMLTGSRYSWIMLWLRSDRPISATYRHIPPFTTARSAPGEAFQLLLYQLLETSPHRRNHLRRQLVGRTRQLTEAIITFIHLKRTWACLKQPMANL